MCIRDRVRVLSEMLGITYAHTAAIGDYFNDFDMLKSVFLPAACGQAPKAVHALSLIHIWYRNRIGGG